MKTINRLTARRVDCDLPPGFYPDGGGLYLFVGKGHQRSWIYRYMLQGVAHDMGVGSLREVSLADARKRVAEYRSLRSQGIDPIEARRNHRADAKLLADRSMTFKQCATAYITAHQPSWRNAKHAAQWTSTLERYVYGVFGDLPVQSIDTPKVLKALEPIWSTKNETATRVRGRVEAILSWATARGNRTGDNPARWRGHLENLLPKPSKVTNAKHHAALPYAEVPKFMVKLREQNGIAALALEFLILTATRNGEVLGARWTEIDLNKQVWTIPAGRMKAEREHRIPLSEEAMYVLEKLPSQRHVDHVFPSLRLGHPLSDMALLALLRRMDRDDITVHGFRSSFRDWVSEKTNFSSEVAEMALAHTIENKVEAAYRRGDLFEKRRKLMDAWGRYCDKPQGGEVIPIQSRQVPAVKAA
jgi:integrase